MGICDSDSTHLNYELQSRNYSFFMKHWQLILILSATFSNLTSISVLIKNVLDVEPVIYVLWAINCWISTFKF